MNIPSGFRIALEITAVWVVAVIGAICVTCVVIVAITKVTDGVRDFAKVICVWRKMPGNEYPPPEVVTWPKVSEGAATFP